MIYGWFVVFDGWINRLDLMLIISMLEVDGYINWLTPNYNFDYSIVAQKVVITLVVGCMARWV